jgi:hypothetical protein
MLLTTVPGPYDFSAVLLSDEAGASQNKTLVRRDAALYAEPFVVIFEGWRENRTLLALMAVK